MKYLHLIAFGLALSMNLSAQEQTKKEKEEQVMEMVKKYVEQKSTSAEYIISSDKTVASKKLLASLEKPLTIDWEGKTLKEAADDIRVFMDINIVIHKSVSKEEMIDFKSKGMKGINVVKWLLRMNNLKGSVIEGVLFITTPEKAPNTDLVMVTYDISDLTNTIKDFPATDIVGDNKLK